MIVFILHDCVPYDQYEIVGAATSVGEVRRKAKVLVNEGAVHLEIEAWDTATNARVWRKTPKELEGCFEEGC